MITSFLEEIMDAFYKPEEIKGEVLFFWKDWMNRYLKDYSKKLLLIKIENKKWI